MCKLNILGYNKLNSFGGGGFGAGSAGLGSLDNVNGHGLSLTGKLMSNFGDQLNVAAQLDFAITHKYDKHAIIFAFRTLPNNSAIPNLNIYGGSVDYMFDKKVGASLGVPPQWQETGYSTMGKLNLFHDRSSALDFSTEASKSVSSFIPSRSW